MRKKNFILKILENCYKWQTQQTYQSEISLPSRNLHNCALLNSKVQEFNNVRPLKLKNTLENLLKISSGKAHNIILNNRKLQVTDTSDLTRNFYTLVANGISSRVILENVNLLGEKHLNLKIEKLKLLHHNVKDTIYLANLSLPKFEALIERDLSEDRINTLSKLLQLDVKEMCENIVKRQFLIFLDLKKAQEILNLLQKYGIGIRDVQKDQWILAYNYENIKEKLDYARNNNLEELKTWMVRVQPEIFEKYIQRRTDNKTILGNGSLIEYLSETLDCNEETAKLLISKHPALKGKSLKKMQEIIDFLCSQGYKPIHICRAPKILLHSVETTRNRLKDLEAQGIKLDSLHILTKSHKQFMHFYENLIKTNKKKKNSTSNPS